MPVCLQNAGCEKLEREAGLSELGKKKPAKQQQQNDSISRNMCPQNKSFPHSAYTHFSTCLPVMC